jgi:hypothetical protein
MPDDQIRLTMKNGDTFDDGLTTRIVPSIPLDRRQAFTFTARSDMGQNAVVASVEVVREAKTIPLGDIRAVKESLPGVAYLPLIGILDNKHAGSTVDPGGEEDPEDENGV